MAQTLYQEWFVRYRFPGHENVPLFPSSLGDIPQGWSVVRLEAIQSPEPYAIQGGPFGSKLGTKDYVDEGIPVIRGANLSEGGRFHADNFVFVSEEKAQELRSNQAVPGDIVVTQRGTLGQIGMIPTTTGYDHFIISQSQMKVTVDRAKASNEYIFFFLKSPESNQRIKNMAISSGVPHINLGSLREFEIVLPPKPLQDRFADVAKPIEDGIELQIRRNGVLRRTRDLLLPKLISGQLDVEHLDIDLGEPVTA
jgi:type I restriction enzyme S subunit